MGKRAYARIARLKNTVTDLFEIFHVLCFFCKKPITNPLKYTTHHKNGDHNDNRPENKAPAHEDCHRSYNAKVILHEKSVARAKKECRI